MAKLVATSVIRGTSRGESHGGVYIVDLDQERVYQPIDWAAKDINWQGHGRDRGLRGIACYRDRVFVVSTDELFEYDPDFELVRSYRNPYLKRCHEICVHEHHLFIASTAYDSILAFNLRKNAFDMALMLQTDGQNLSMVRYDPNGDDGPLAMDKFHINSVHCEQGGMYIAGLRTDGLLLYNGQRIGMSATLPAGTHNARPFRDGLIFNDTENNVLRYSARDGIGDFALGVPRFAEADLLNSDTDDPGLARQGFGRGLCVISDTKVAAGSSPATISLYDIEQQELAMTVNISMDVRNTINGLAVWPY